MARPSAELVIELSTAAGTDKYLAIEAIYGLTYRGDLVSVRRETTNIRGISIKYPKTQWPNEGSARRQVRILNKRYDTEDFGYICLYKNPDHATEAMKAPKNIKYEAN
jgi:hypothetical protein